MHCGTLLPRLLLHAGKITIYVNFVPHLHKLHFSFFQGFQLYILFFQGSVKASSTESMLRDPQPK